MIRTHNIENTDTTYLRIWQKINLGKEVLEPDFFKQVKAEKEEKTKPESLFLKILEEERTIVIKKGITND